MLNFGGLIVISDNQPPFYFDRRDERRGGIMSRQNGPLIRLWIGLACAAMSRAGAADRPVLNADHAAFRYDDRAAFVEVYYQAPGSAMTLRVEAADSVYVERSWNNEAPEGAEGAVPLSLGRAYFVAPEGDYRVVLEAGTSVLPEGNATVEFPVSIRPFTPDRLSFSDLELASDIRRAEVNEAGNPFAKNSLFIIPRPTLLFGDPQPILRYYAELYGIDKGVPGGAYEVRSSVTDTSGNPVAAVRPMVFKRKKMHDSAVETGELGLFPLSTGVYCLRLAAADSSGNELTVRTKRFFVVKAGSQDVAARTPPATGPGLFTGLEGESLKAIFEQSRYLMTDSDIKLYKALQNDNARRQALEAFWKRKDLDPQTPSNEFFSEYQSRIRSADTQFGVMNLNGWKTDRGRVFCIYGPPSDIERFPNPSETIPYEIWKYDGIEGGVEFVFADFSGFKRFILVHSTKRGETYDPEYMQRIKRTY
jgi:GWxTD domain-containing protein